MLEKINLEWAKSFVVFVESAGIEQAAARLGITQPAVSQHLSKLAAALDVQILQKQGTRKVLTQQGTELYRGLSQQLKSMDDLLRIAKFEGAKEKDVRLRLAINKEIYYRICDKMHFDGQLEVSNLRSSAAVGALLRREVDIAVGRIVPDSADIVAVKWYSDTFTVAYPAPWQKEVDAQGLKVVLSRRPFVLNQETQQTVEDALIAMDFLLANLTVNRQVTDWTSIFRLIEVGQGWSVVPTSFQRTAKIRLAQIPPRNLPKTQFYILYHRSVRNFPGFRRLLESMSSSILPG